MPDDLTIPPFRSDMCTGYLKMKLVFRLLAYGSALSASVVGAEPAAHPVVAVAQGNVAGVRHDDVQAFLGIPYAAAPVGHNRWRPPLPAAPWTGTFAAERFGPSCPQAIVQKLGPWTHEYLPGGPVSEDCLTLNVWRPGFARKRLPVLVWIHGGGFTSGSSSVPIYDGAPLASRGIVVVSINYRLGVLGFLAHPEFRGRGGGNFGLMDQIAALKWVRANIKSFGGDPRRVTIAGQSAGALSVHHLILSSQARGLFQQAIPQSGMGLGVGADHALTPRDDAETGAVDFLSAAGIDTVDQARSLTYAQLVGAYVKVGGRPGTAGGMRMGPYADGEVLPLDPLAAFKAGRFNDTPVMIGLTADEASGLNAGYRLSDPGQYSAWLENRFHENARLIERIYPATGEGSPVPSVLRDAGIFAMTNWSALRGAVSRKPLYSYIWTHVQPGPEAELYRAFHTSEVPYVFGNLAKSPERAFKERDHQVARMLQSYWVNFIQTGNPNGPGLAPWQPDHQGTRLMELGRRFGPYPPLDPQASKAFGDVLKSRGSLLVM